MPHTKKLWQPSREQILGSQMHTFCHRIVERYRIAPDYEALRQWSVQQRERFWEEMRVFAAIDFSTPAKSVCSGSGMLDTRWFEGARLNFARHLLRFDDDSDAILFENETGESRRLSHRALRDKVARCAAALRRDGVKPGDRVAGYLPNIPETVIAMLATASLGAVWSSCSPDFGEQAVVDRFGQIEPKVLFTVDGYPYSGKTFSLEERVAAVRQRIPSIQRVVKIPYVHTEVANSAGNTVSLRNYLGPPEQSAPPLQFEEVPFNHPLYIMYSSGTTGVPKCIVHGHGGTLIQHAKEHLLHSDVRPGDHLFYFTTCGWMMWNWLVSGLGTGAAIVLFDGNPGHPTIQHLWEMAARLRITHFGTSPKFLSACQKSDIHPIREHDLSALRCVLSTGSPLSDELFEWVYANVKHDVQLASISGGTDIISCFMLGNPMLPVYAGQIQCRGLGMDVQAWDENGKPVIGRKGELVCCAPFPSQPVGFWNDPDGRKYRAAYFDYYEAAPNQSPERQRAGIQPKPVVAGSSIENRKSKTENSLVWRHGDYIEITDSGGIIVYGRSDATLNPGGVRIGTAEIYRVVEGLHEITDSIVVGRNTPDLDVEVCLFVVLRPSVALTAELARKIRNAIADNTSKRHVPKHVKQVTAIPYTISGKKVELAIQAMLHGEPVKNRDALANPEALEQYRGILDKRE